jgi:lipopolysaccharide export system protein LptA
MHRRETTPLCCVWIRWAVVAMFASVAVHAQADFEDAPIASEPSPAAAPVQPAAPVNSAPPSQSETPSAPPPTRTGGAGKSSSGVKSSPKIPPAPASSAAGQGGSGGSSNSNSGIDHNSNAPIAYSAQSLEGSLNQGRVLLKGDVEIEQGDALMKSDVAEIFSAKGTTTPNRALAKGRVSLFKSATAQSAELRAVANELEFFMASRKAVLKGKPKIWRGRELLQGEVIEVFLDTNEIKVRGARGVMDPAANNPPVGNQNGSGVQTAPAKKTSGQKPR